jgi:carboxypeptidase Taq
LYAAISKVVPSLYSEINEGSTASVFEWLKQHIYKFGRYYTSGELCRQATGEELNSDFFIDYANAKFNSIYEI